MKTRKNYKLLITNLIDYTLFLLPAWQLNLFNENYSTLSLYTRGYLYLLFLGIMIGILLYYETSLINNKKSACIMLFSLITGTIIPHHVPYNFQGYMHLICAYTGFAGMMIITYSNIIKNDIKLRNLFVLMSIGIACLFIRFGKVTTIMEITIMTFVLSINYYLVHKHKLQ